MTFGQRFLLTLIIVLLFLFAIAAIGYFSGGWENDPAPLSIRFALASAETKPELCMDDSMRERTRALMLEALDQAFKDHVMHLYEVMMKAGGDPQRAATGTRQGLKAYISARDALANWNPPECSG